MASGGLPNVTRDTLARLKQKKNVIEREINELGGVLESQKNVGMHESLVDAEGYPRLDVDVYQVRHARHRIICLQNDHKAVMKEIEQCLHAFHANNKPPDWSASQDVEMADAEPQQNTTPFAKVNEVSQNSPAELAGLAPGDLLIKFGSITKDNFTGLPSIASVVQHSVGQSIEVVVERNNKAISLHLTPNTWSGKGLLGCNLVVT